MVFVSNGVWAKVVEIPDSNFRKALEQALGIIENGEDMTKEVLAKLTILDANNRQIRRCHNNDW